MSRGSVARRTTVPMRSRSIVSRRSASASSRIGGGGLGMELVDLIGRAARRFHRERAELRRPLDDPVAVSSRRGRGRTEARDVHRKRKPQDRKPLAWQRLIDERPTCRPYCVLASKSTAIARSSLRRARVRRAPGSVRYAAAPWPGGEHAVRAGRPGSRPVRWRRWRSRDEPQPAAFATSDRRAMRNARTIDSLEPENVGPRMRITLSSPVPGGQTRPGGWRCQGRDRGRRPQGFREP